MFHWYIAIKRRVETDNNQRHQEEKTMIFSSFDADTWFKNDVSTFVVQERGFALLCENSCTHLLHWNIKTFLYHQTMVILVFLYNMIKV